MIKLLLLFLLFLSCAVANQAVLIQDGGILYSPWHERAFCLRPDGTVYNILDGGWMSVEMPLCSLEDIPVHTHPWWAEDFPNAFDLAQWDEYKSRYGNSTFGLMTSPRKVKLYRR